MCRGQPEVRPQDHYQDLGVPRNATPKEIVSAYKGLALRFHPDKNPDNKAQAEASFRQAAAAYETLRDPERRQLYDQQLGKLGKSASPNTATRREDDVFRMYLDGRCGLPAGKPGCSGGFAYTDMFDLEGLLGTRFAGGSSSNKGTPGHSPTPHLPHAVPSGTAVVVRSLVDAAAHNGKEAEVCTWDEERGRYEVRLCEGGFLSLRPGNITQICLAEVTNFRRAPSLNGQKAKIHDYDASKEQYLVTVNESPLTMNMPLANCVLPLGTRVLTCGLSDVQLNEKMAQITNIDRDDERYIVRCQDGRQLKIKFNKVLC